LYSIVKNMTIQANTQTRYLYSMVKNMRRLGCMCCELEVWWWI